MTEAAFSYRPGIPCYGASFTRATTATYVDSAPDLALVYWPGQLHATETFTRATAATYVRETDAPESQ